MTTHNVRIACPTPSRISAVTPLSESVEASAPKHPRTQPVERNQQDELEGIDRSVDQLHCRKIQAKYDSRQSAQERRRTQHWRNAQNDSQRDRQCNLLRRYTLAQQLEEGL